MQENDVLNFENEIGKLSSEPKLGISQIQTPPPPPTSHYPRVEETKSVRIGKGPTLEEKIDYIYAHLKAQKRNARIKLFLKIFIIIAIYYFAVMIYPTIPQEKIDAVKGEVSKMVSHQISSLAKPIIEDITNDMVKNMGIPTGDSGAPEETVSQSKIDEFLKKHPELKGKIKQ